MRDRHDFRVSAEMGTGVAYQRPSRHAGWDRLIERYVEPARAPESSGLMCLSSSGALAIGEGELTAYTGVPAAFWAAELQHRRDDAWIGSPFDLKTNDGRGCDSDLSVSTALTRVRRRARAHSIRRQTKTVIADSLQYIAGRDGEEAAGCAT